MLKLTKSNLAFYGTLTGLCFLSLGLVGGQDLSNDFSVLHFVLALVPALIGLILAIAAWNVNK